MRSLRFAPGSPACFRSDRRLRGVALHSLCGALLLAPASATAATLYAAAISTPSVSQGDGDSPTPLSFSQPATVPCQGFPASCWGASASAALSLAVSGSVHVQNGGFPPPDYSLSGSVTAHASFSGYDVLLSGPSGQSTLTSLNLSFDGYAFVVADGGVGSASVNIGTSLSGPGGSATDGGALTADPMTQVTTGSGLLSAWFGSPLGVTTSSLLVEAGDVVTIGLGLGGYAECSTIALASYSICPSLFDVFAFSFTTSGPESPRLSRRLDQLSPTSVAELCWSA